MKTFRPKQILAAALIAAAPAAFAAVPVIGVAVSQGNMIVDSRQSPGSASIFDGGVLQTGDAPSQVRLKDGGQLRLGADSRGKVFADHVDLEKGSASVSGVEARVSGLRVRTDASGMATVTVQNGAVQVASVTGGVHVFNAQGINVANVKSGSSLSLRVSGSAADSSLVGCAVRDNDGLLLTDETSNVTVRLGGDAVHTGKRVLVTGMISPASGKSGASVIKVASVKELNGPCAPATAAAPVMTASASAAPLPATYGSASTGAATGTTAAIIATSTGFSQASSTVVAGVTSTGITNLSPINSTNTASGTTGGGGISGGHPVCISPCTY